MDYEGRICRSPFERGAFMLPVMVGCTHNKCKFCGLFKHLDFRVLPDEQVNAEIKRVADQGGNPKVVFLGDGNAFCLPTKRLLEICEEIHNNFSATEQINMDATVKNILSKTDEELRDLASAGIYNLYVGIECGLDDVLAFMNKGNTLTEAKLAISRLKEAGLVYSAHMMSGIAGAGRGEENARSLAEFFSETQPLNICNFDLGMHRKVELWQEYKAGRYKISSAQERFLEEEILISEIKAEGEMHYDAVFEVPPLRFIGTLPQDKNKLVEQFRDAQKKYSACGELYCIWE